MSSKLPRANLLVAASIVVAAVIIAAAISMAPSPGTVTKTETIPETVTAFATSTLTLFEVATAETTSSTQSFQCVITGQPDGFFLRVVYDSNQTSAPGALVYATNEPATCNGTPATSQTTSTLITTSGTEWYSFNYGNDGGYSISVKYSGMTYNFTAGLSPLSVTCASLFVPSGRTNVTVNEFQSVCPRD